MSNLSIQYQTLHPKLLKIKDQVSQATDYPGLEKSIKKLRIIKQKVEQQMTNNKSKREIIQIISGIEAFIKEKTKKLKKQMISRGSISTNRIDSESVKKMDISIRPQKPRQRQEVSRTLKHSRSAQNMQSIKRNSHLKHPLNNSNSQTLYLNPQSTKYRKYQQPSFIDQETMPAIHNRILSEETYDQEKNMYLLNDKVFKSTQKIDELTTKLRQLEAKNSNQKNNEMLMELHSKREHIFDELNNKIKEKSFLIEELRGKNEYLKSMNEQLKARILNEQRRHEDYIQSLQQEIKNLRKTVEKSKKNYEQLEEDYEELEEKNQAIIEQLKKLATKHDEQINKRELMQRNLSNQIKQKTKELEQQLNSMAMKLQNYKKGDRMLENANIQIEKLTSFNTKLTTQLHQLEKQKKSSLGERQKLEEGFYQILEENQALKSELKDLTKTKQLLGDQLLDMKDRFSQLTREKQQYEKTAAYRGKQRTAKMKELKSLFNSLAVS